MDDFNRRSRPIMDDFNGRSRPIMDDFNGRSRPIMDDFNGRSHLSPCFSSRLSFAFTHAKSVCDQIDVLPYLLAKHKCRLIPLYYSVIYFVYISPVLLLWLFL